jgi:outer membrane immunogenic protein
MPVAAATYRRQLVVWGILMKTINILATAALLALPEFASAQQAPPSLGSNSSSSSSWLAGAQAGYNWQSGSLVYGIETDISGTGLKNSMNTTLQSLFVPPPTAFTTSSIDWYGTLRGRLGWATGPVMIYGTGGLAYGRTSVNSTLNDNFVPASLNSQSSSVKAGWVAGFGIEYLLRPNLLVNLGYQYVDLGTTSLVASGPLPGGGSLNQSVNARGQFQVVSAGLSWLFSAGPAAVDRPKYTKAPLAPSMSEPWSGFYAGGHGGGAWGNRTDATYSDILFPPSDIRLKRDIVLIDRRDDGLGIYSYRYLWSDTLYVGMMAQEVALIHPDAIVRNDLDDYLRVDYSRLGSRLMTLPEWEAKGKGNTL